MNKQKIFFIIIFILGINQICIANSIDSLLIVLKNTKTDTEKAIIYNKISDKYLDYDFSKSRLYADSALLVAPKNCDKKIISDVYINIGNSFYFKGDLDSTLYYYTKSYNEIKNTDNKKEIASSLNRMGLIYESKSEYQTASEYFMKSLKLFEEIESQLGIANVYNNLGIINDRLLNSNKSLEYYNNALTIYQKGNDKIGEANVLNNIATVYTDIKRYDRALIYAKKSLVIFKEINKQSQMATAYNNIGTLYSLKEKYDSALHYMDKSLTINNKIESKTGTANDYNEIAHIFAKKNNNEKALEYLLKSLKIRREVGNILSEFKTLKDVSLIYQNLGNYKEALNYHIEYTNLKDSVFSEKTELQISELQIKYETEKKDSEIKLLTKDALIKRNFTILLIAIITGLLIISIMFLYLFKTKSKLLKSNKLQYNQKEEINKLARLKQEAENRLLDEEVRQQYEINRLQKDKHLSELQHKNRELTTSAMHLITKNNILFSIQKSLEEISQNSDPAFRKNAKKIIREINQNINLDADWEQFKLHFEKVNSDFFQNLKTDFPQLTKGDLKICAYIRINLSSKEIAQMLNITLGGVNKKLYRLRKKLNISAEINLTNFLMKF